MPITITEHNNHQENDLICLNTLYRKTDARENDQVIWLVLEINDMSLNPGLSDFAETFIIGQVGYKHKKCPSPGKPSSGFGGRLKFLEFLKADSCSIFSGYTKIF